MADDPNDETMLTNKKDQKASSSTSTSTSNSTSTSTSISTLNSSFASEQDVELQCPGAPRIPFVDSFDEIPDSPVAYSAELQHIFNTMDMPNSNVRLGISPSNSVNEAPQRESHTRMQPIGLGIFLPDGRPYPFDDALESTAASNTSSSHFSGPSTGNMSFDIEIDNINATGSSKPVTASKRKSKVKGSN